MSYTIKYSVFTLLICFAANFVSLCKGITDIIQPLNLSAGKIDSVLISDLFYAKDYNTIKILSSPFVDAKLNSDKTKFILTPNKNFEGISLIEFVFKGDTSEIPVRVNKEQILTFKFQPKQRYKEVNLFGSFNSWNKSNMEMKNNDGIWEISIPLEPGRYQYKFYADSKELIDPGNPEKIPNGMGDYNSVLTVEPIHKSNPFLHIKDYNYDGSTVKFNFIYQNDESKKVISAKNLIALLDNKKIASNSINVDNNLIEISLDKKILSGEKTLRAAVTENSRATNFQNIILFDGKPAGDKNNFTWHDAIIYSAIIDRFKDGDTSINKPIVHDSLFEKANYMGGDFQGIIDKFNDGYFDSLGVTTLWISPVYDNTNHAFREFPKPHRWFSGYHGYWPVKPRAVEEEFGTMEKLNELVEDAHKHNVKILLDIVAHHVHQEHLF